MVAESIAGGCSIHPRNDSPYPDIFIYSHVADGITGVAGYSNADGLWGQLYRGKITRSGAELREEKVDIHVAGDTLIKSVLASS